MQKSLLLFLVAALVVTLAAHAQAAPLQFGSGAGLSGGTSADIPNQERLNVDRNIKYNLYPGTYNVLDFSLNVVDANNGTGTITPMLVSGTPGNYTTVWVGSAYDPSANGVQTAATYTPGSQTFTLSSLSTVYAGAFTGSGGSEIPGYNGSTGITDHDSVFTAPSGVGQSVTGFTNPNLGRAYAFGINADIATSAIAPIVTSTNGNAAAVGTDLLQTNFGSVAATGVVGTFSGGTDVTGAEPVLRNGTATTTAGYNTGNATTTGLQNGAQITYNLAPNAYGYQINQIDLFHGWRDGGRDRISSFDVAYSTLSNPTTWIDMVVNADSGNYAASYGRTSVVPDGGNTFLATGVGALRFTFDSTENNGAGISEIDVLGVAATPEPASIAIWSLLGLGSLGFACWRWRRRRTA